jgi:predicted Fe-Mo cluster-binding NifX family protein
MRGGETMDERIVALPTKGNKGIADVVSDMLGRAKTFTIVNIDGKTTEKIEVIPNPAISYKQGAGPVAVKTLIDKGVTTVVAGEFGPGVSTLLKQFNITMVKVKQGTAVAEAIQQFLEHKQVAN